MLRASRYDVRVRLGWLLVLCACGGTWAAAPAGPPSCADTAAHVLALVGARDPRLRGPKLRDAFQRRCLADAWDEPVRACLVATTSLTAPRRCKALLTPDQRAKLERDLKLVSRMPTYNWVPQPCGEYKVLLESLDSCNGFPSDAQDALRVTYRKKLQDWQDGALDTWQIESDCRSMTEGLRKAMVTACGM